MYVLKKYEGTLLDYVRGGIDFADVERALHGSIRRYASRRAAKWSMCPALEDDIAQTLLLTLWQALDDYSAASEREIWDHCGARMEFGVKRFLRATALRDSRMDYVVNEAVEDEDDHACALVELLHDLDGIKDEGVRAYALAAVDSGGRDVVTRLASDAVLIAKLGWSDVERDSNAARRRAQRNDRLIEALGGVG
jgi:hypothetical protein